MDELRALLFGATIAAAIGPIALLIIHNGMRHGLAADLDAPSLRYSSAPIDGPNQGKTIAPVWQDAVQKYYSLMGWDKATSRPLPETLKGLGLEHLVKDIW